MGLRIFFCKFSKHADMQGIESAQRSPTSQAVSATPSLNEVLTFCVMSTHIFGLNFFQNIYETRTFLMHITHRVCFYGIKHCLLRSKTRHFWIFLKKSKQISTHILGLRIFFCKFSKHADMQGIESAQRSPTSQAVSATPSLKEVLTFRVMSTHIIGLRIFFQNILETRTFLMHITHRVCFYGI